MSVECRRAIEETVRRDLLGPAGGESEFLPSKTWKQPRLRYLVGMLAPAGTRPEPADDERVGAADDDESEDGKDDSQQQRVRNLFPSSIGLSFRVEGGTDAIMVGASWGRYEVVGKGDERGWQRSPCKTEPIRIEMREGPPRSFETGTDSVRIRAIVRRSNRDFAVSVFLVNEQVSPEKKSHDSLWLFQPSLWVEGVGGAPVFVGRASVGTEGDDPDQQMLALLYRKDLEFAFGHSVATRVAKAPGRIDRAVRIETEILPAHEVPRVEAGEETRAVLEMERLAGAKKEDVGPFLGPLLDEYEAWIGRQRARLSAEADLAAHRQAAEEALQGCDEALRRMRGGVEILRRDPQVLDAFRFANRAMHLQRLHTRIATGRRRDGTERSEADAAAEETPRWRPFQIAFVLLNLASIADPHHADREVADLLWFPTGGGKTEAYLGLTAFTLALRRLRKDLGGRTGESGVAVLMRYTLRLLTLQQFQRAAALICACEVIRRENEARWGGTPFRIGLWVGAASTPNSTKESAEAVKRIRDGKYPYRGSPAQLEGCPWCGASIDPKRDITVLEPPAKEGRTLIHCGDADGRCPFSQKRAPKEGLPVVVVDEEVYRLLPSLLIATVDKFARLPWVGETQLLFGQTQFRCDRHGYLSAASDDAKKRRHQAEAGLPAARIQPTAPLRPPDLIIQDELHLISGPLGTLVGLYETAVDALASWEVDGKTVRPKVIASTATIRQAHEQIDAVFARRTRIFPAPALDADDTFFARRVEVGPDEPGRLYVGLCAPGVSVKRSLIRLYVALLASAQQQFEKDPAGADAYMTLVGYFNSLRELGGMVRLVHDDIANRLKTAAERGLARRFIPRTRELTSRRSSTEIPRILAELDIPFEPKGPPGDDDDDKDKKTRRAVDVLLATNMISVGVDVERFGLMAVNGQPKTTSEYIQATSRVGRRRAHPGLIYTLYNWARPRDLSHYETFDHYHATFYKHVEAISVTPFASRALDRGLAGVLVALVRLAGEAMVREEDVSKIDPAHPLVVRAVETIAARVRRVRPEKEDEARRRIAARLDDWIREAKLPGRDLLYSKRTKKAVRLLQDAESGEAHPFTCLNSLRGVEAEVPLLLETGPARP